MLEFKNVTFRYDVENQLMLKDLSFNIPKGQFISIIGASGCGKSTIFRLINGLEKMQEGEILVGGQPISELKNYSAYMPQKDLLLPWRSIAKNLAVPMEIAKVSKNEQINRINDILNKLGLDEYKDKYPRELSGGMKQRIAFGRTLLTGSELLMLDEPFSALDSLTRMDLQEWLINQWKDLGKTILFITHDVEEAIFLSQKIFVMQGRPVTKIEEVSIDVDYPRDRNFLKRSDIAELKENLISKLRHGG